MKIEMLKFWINKALLVAVILLVGSYIYWSWDKAGSKLASGLFTDAVDVFTDEEVPDAVVAMPNGLMIIPKDFAQDRLDLPKRFYLDLDEQVTNVVTVPPDVRKTTAISTVNTQTGITDILIRPEKLSFLGFEDNTELGVEYGIGRDGSQVGIYGRMDLFRTGPVRYGIYGNVDGDGDYKFAGRAFYRF